MTETPKGINQNWPMFTFRIAIKMFNVMAFPKIFFFLQSNKYLVMFKNKNKLNPGYTG